MALELLVGRLSLMRPRTQYIAGFHLNVSGVEKEIYEEFERCQEMELVEIIDRHFSAALRDQSGIKLENVAMWAEVETKIDAWFTGICARLHLECETVKHAREAIRHRMRDHLIKAIRAFLGGKTSPA